MYCLPRDHTQFLLLKPLDTAHIESRDTVGVSLKGCDFAWRPLDLPAGALPARDSVHEGAAAPKDHVMQVHARDEDDEITTESCHMPVLSDISFEVEQGIACDAAAAVNFIHGDHMSVFWSRRAAGGRGRCSQRKVYFDSKHSGRDLLCCSSCDSTMWPVTSCTGCTHHHQYFYHQLHLSHG